VVGAVASATTATSATTAGTVTTAAQPNITSVGTLTSLSSSGNITTGANVIINGSFLVLPTAATNPANPVEGSFYFNTGGNVLRIYSGGIWRNV
jgi:hypothetical protein